MMNVNRRIRDFYRYTTVLAVTIFSLCSSTRSQSSDSAKYILSFDPLYMVIHGFKVNLDIHYKAEQWFTLSPELYLFESKNSIDEYSSWDYINYHGFGVEISYKYIINKQMLPKGIYLGYWLNYKYYYAELGRGEKSTQNLDGSHANSTATTGVNYINRFGGGFKIGLQNLAKSGFYVDAYFRSGFMYSLLSDKNISSSSSKPIKIDESGMIPLVYGLRFGIAL